ncbi:MAG: hypothetical protein AAFV95_23310 [Bacteroidota bacterium]
MRTLKSICLPLLLVGFFLVGCQKEDTIPQQDYQSATDLLAAEVLFDEVFAMTDNASKQQGDLDGIVSDQPKAQDRGCMGVDLTTAGDWPNIFPITLTLDFGDDCTTQNGNEISGKIVTTFSGKLSDEGTTATLELQNFAMNGFQISGAKEWTNLGLNNDGMFHYRVEVKDGQIVTPNGKTITYETQNIRTWVEGMNTNFWTNGIDGITDDVWEVTGTASGINRNGVAYTATIQNPWRHQANCEWLTAGSTDIQTSNLPDLIKLDFGDGQCDDKAVISIGNFSREIQL